MSCCTKILLGEVRMDYADIQGVINGEAAG